MAERRAVLLAGGGTAGHVNPLLATAAALRAADPELAIVVLGTEQGLESRLVPEAGWPLHTIPRVPVPRTVTPEWFSLPTRLRDAVAAVEQIILAEDVGVVVGFGGYVSGPAYLAARRLKVPVVVHEQNARPGLANRLGARGAAAVGVTFASTRLPRAQVVGLPLRQSIAGLVASRAADAAGTRSHAAAELGLDPTMPTLVVTGGSSGAVAVNTAVAGAAAALVDGAQVLHLTGIGKADDVRDTVRGTAGAERYHVREYLMEMELALAVADLVVARAGAGTVAELAAAGIPAVYVPLPIGNGEQRLNAAGLVEAGGGLMISDAAFTSDAVRDQVVPLLHDPERLEQMAAAAAAAGVPDATERLAQMVLEVLDAAVAAEQAVAEADGLMDGDEVLDDLVTTDADELADDLPAAENPAEENPADANPAEDSPAEESPADHEPAAVTVELAAAADVAAPAADAIPATDLDHDFTADVPAPADLGTVHLMGIGGAGMSAVAELLLAQGVQVSGCDSRGTDVTRRLAENGAAVTVGHDPSHLDGVQTLVVSSAVKQDNPELQAARQAGLLVLHRSQALASLMADHDAVIVAGAHGKTTTSAMVASALVAAGLDPSWAIGGVMRSGGSVSGAHHGEGEVLVAEADESDGSFLAYRPLVAVVTNVEPDHLDHYGTAAALTAAFADMTRRIRRGGALIACADDPGASALVADVREDLAAGGVDVITYGRADADVTVTIETLDAASGDGAAPAQLVTVTDADGLTATMNLRFAGEHVALDAAAAWVAAVTIGADPVKAAMGLSDFAGTGRRFDVRGVVAGVRVVDDYAHHPTEIRALVAAARAVTAGQVIVLFQPHLFSRTATFAEAFAEALAGADHAVVTDVYAAREEPDGSVTGATITGNDTTGRLQHTPSLTDAAAAVVELAGPGDTILLVGAGDVVTAGPVVLELLRARGRADE